MFEYFQDIRHWRIRDVVVLMNVFAMGIFDSGKTMSIISCEEMVLLSTITASGTISS
jgi:hypothetical protein